MHSIVLLFFITVFKCFILLFICILAKNALFAFISKRASFLLFQLCGLLRKANCSPANVNVVQMPTQQFLRDFPTNAPPSRVSVLHMVGEGNERRHVRLAFSFRFSFCFRTLQCKCMRKCIWASLNFDEKSGKPWSRGINFRSFDQGHCDRIFVLIENL